jgi:hypothetical protein
MTQPLNYTPKAIEALMPLAGSDAPGSRAGISYLIDKLRAAEVFVLADHGQLLDRGKPRPEVPGQVFKPPFPVVALEYTAEGKTWDEGFYNASACSRRIALAWDWSDDLPPAMRAMMPTLPLEPGVVVASIAYYDERATWLPIAAAMHFSYECVWQDRPPSGPFVAAMLESGRLKPALAKTSAVGGTIVPLLPEALVGIGVALGGPDALQDVLQADLMDEVNAYLDLCTALACKNVGTRSTPAPAPINKARLRKGRPPLKGFHVLELDGGEMTGLGGTLGDHSAPRAHLRRGHIRRIAGGRVTWVNQTVVRGRGDFVEKVYAVGRQGA